MNNLQIHITYKLYDATEPAVEHLLNLPLPESKGLRVISKLVNSKMCALLFELLKYKGFST